MNLVCEKTTIKPVSRCLYCSSVSYGKGCRFAPKGVHFHADDTKKCSYCGSPNYGKGCRMNPFNDLHLHGIPYNSMIDVKLNEAVRKNVLLNDLSKPINDFAAYQIGVIDDYGNKVREPVSEEDVVAYSPYIRTVLSLRKHLGGKLELINNLTLLEKNITSGYNTDTHIKLLTFKTKYDEKISEIVELIEEAIKSGLTYEELDAYITK
jgi:hypothetical protein